MVSFIILHITADFPAGGFQYGLLEKSVFKLLTEIPWAGTVISRPILH